MHFERKIWKNQKKIFFDFLALHGGEPPFLGGRYFKFGVEFQKCFSTVQVGFPWATNRYHIIPGTPSNVGEKVVCTIFIYSSRCITASSVIFPQKIVSVCEFCMKFGLNFVSDFESLTLKPTF